MAQSKEERVHSVFEKIYQNYDKMNTVISFQQHKKWRAETMKKMNVQRGATSLDLCCGTGDWTIALAKAAGPEGKVIGLDFSHNMLQVADEKIKQESLTNIELIQGNAMELPFEDNQFDYVTIGFGLRNVPDYLQVLKEMERVLKPGGMAVCLETSQPELPVYRQLYYAYFRFVMPIMGKFLAKSFKEYSWLQESACDFPGMNELAQMFWHVGLVDVIYKSFTGGVAAAHIGIKKKCPRMEIK
ncbi:demethylmenaquinone methyltransferase [Lederbergia sp. NSJ-179]|uniref:demethylmenaquinone methyltransferase n=1 Tax=Lederbergia sp. NSJ-179 TaxID=2931402 RepID=UPI001FD17A86|nr:demethylmenaquinone methyltransferase [Lederbergia sp. NSJ-179]MCJ7839458.1 demethylmenaquinone methyltransferase [Lederbergia sp. NSJ-179]